jgi:hypothetical protein
MRKFPMGENWPTPAAIDGTRDGTKLRQMTLNSGGRGFRKGISLHHEVTNWPTPITHNDRGGPSKKSAEAGAGKDLVEEAQDWPTPRTRARKGDKGSGRRLLEGKNPGLNDTATDWPTPAARDSKGANSELHVTEKGSGRKHMDQLANFVEHSFRSLPPDQRIGTSGGRSSEEKTGSTTKKPKGWHLISPRRLNPAFVNFLMGSLWWWTRAERIRFASPEMESWFSRLRSLLSSLTGGLGPDW